jgi:acetyl esterase/lipase
MQPPSLIQAAILLLTLEVLPCAFGQSAPVPPALPPEPSTPGITLNVWPDGRMPGHGAPKPENTSQPNADYVVHITNVSTPMITVYRADAKAGPTPAMLICPGGGYGQLAYNKEGTEIAAWLNSIGITGIILKYRVPGNRDGAFQDAQRAIRLARAHAHDWNIAPDRLGIIGFSAGGHLAARSSANADQVSYPPIDAIDQLSCRPDFTVLVYPAYLEVAGKLAPELTLSSAIPPTFIAHTEDDHAFVEGSKLYFAALQANKVPSEFALFPHGGHGYGLRCKSDAKVWPSRCEAWLRQRGILPSL